MKNKKVFKKGLFIPGVGVVPEDCEKIKNLFQKYDLSFKVLNSRKILDCKKINKDKVLNLIESMIKEDKIDFLFGSSLGGAVAIECVLTKRIKTKNLILINPHLKQIDNYFSKILKRLKDSGRRNNKKSFSLIKITNFIRKYLPRLKIIRRELSFVEKLTFLKKDFSINTKTFFLLGEKDETCPISNYNLIKSNFLNKKLFILLDTGHDWDDKIDLLEKKFLEMGLFRKT